ncbi:Hypothetical protein A7982_05055 [Minicystis rosea]|nr:Hypothetical protein A7982_05055 [Minicystis rosea]
MTLVRTGQGSRSAEPSLKEPPLPHREPPPDDPAGFWHSPCSVAKPARKVNQEERSSSAEPREGMPHFHASRRSGRVPGGAPPLPLFLLKQGEV